MINIKNKTVIIKKQTKVVEINGKEYPHYYLWKIACDFLDDNDYIEHHKHFTFGYNTSIDNELRENFIKEGLVIQINNEKYDYFQITDKEYEFFEELIK